MNMSVMRVDTLVSRLTTCERNADDLEKKSDRMNAGLLMRRAHCW